MTVTKTNRKTGGIEIFFQKVFGLMAAAVGVTALTTFIAHQAGVLDSLMLVNVFGVPTKLTATYYIIAFGALGLSLWAQFRAFSMKPSTAAILLFLYSILIGVTLLPLISISNTETVLIALGLAAVMFVCMALFGYKTVKNLSFLGTFLFMGMIGLILVGIISIFTGPFGVVFNQIICLFGVLIFALFTAYDMQSLKNAYYTLGNGNQKNQLAVLGALHLYISFVAMFEYILSLLNSRD